MNKVISVIVPVYNAEKTVDKCVKSIVNQSYANLLVILVENGSTDNSYQKCLRLAEKDARIKVLRSKKGISVARNVGLEYAKSLGTDFYAFVDSDDYIDEFMYEKLISIAVADNADMVFCKYNRVYSNNVIKQCYEDLDKLKNKDLTIFFSKNNRIMGAIWRTLYSKNLIDIRFDEDITLAEDLIYIMYCVKQSGKIKTIDDYLYNYIVPDMASEYKHNECKLLSAKKKIAHLKTLLGESKTAIIYAEQFAYVIGMIADTIKNNEKYMQQVRLLLNDEFCKEAISKLYYDAYKKSVVSFKSKILAVLVYHRLWRLLHVAIS